MPTMNTIEDVQAIFQGDNPEDMAAAKFALQDVEFQKLLLENHGVDTTGMDDATVWSTLLAHSRDGLD